MLMQVVSSSKPLHYLLDITHEDIKYKLLAIYKVKKEIKNVNKEFDIIKDTLRNENEIIDITKIKNPRSSSYG